VGDVGGTALHRIEPLERRHQFAGGEQADLEPPARHGLHPFDEAFGIGAETRGLARPGHDHVPAHPALRDRRRRHQAGGGRGRCFEHLPSFHLGPPCPCRRLPRSHSAGGRAAQIRPLRKIR